MKIETAVAMGAAAFKNGLRLHRDAVYLFRGRRHPSAFQLSILSQEEIGKAFMLQEYVYRVGISEEQSGGSTGSSGSGSNTATGAMQSRRRTATR